jgi:hypothetical protein
MLDIFQQRLPSRPYCTDDVQHGLRIRRIADAIKLKHVQPNPPHAIAWLVFDVDFVGGAFAWETANLPPPTIAVVNPLNGHAHLFFGIKVPVAKSDFARDSPLRYIAAIEFAYRIALHADAGYAGLIAKNPLHSAWRVLVHRQLYDLDYLAEWVVLPRRIPERDTTGLGRNCVLFDELRAWAYQFCRLYKRNGASETQWQAAVAAQAARLNEFPTPLPLRETTSVARSVAKWTWKRFNEAEFGKLQASRGRRGGIASGTARRAASEDMRTSALLMRAAGKSIREIAGTLDLGKSTVGEWLRQ